MVKNTAMTKWAEGFELASLGLHETAEENSFLTKVSEYIAENSTITRVDAWKCIVKLRDLTKKPSAKESILSLVNPGQYPAEVAEFRDSNFNTLELGYKYIVSQGEIKPNTVSEQQGTDSSNTVKSESSQQAETPEPTEDTEDQDSTEKVGNVTKEKLVQPFTIGDGTVPIMQSQSPNNMDDELTKKLDKALEKVLTPEIITKGVGPLMNIINIIEKNPDAVINLLNGLSALLVTPAPQPQQGQPNIQVQTCQH